MDKALTCHAGGQGSYPDTTNILVLLSTQIPLPLSHTMSDVTCSSVNHCAGEKKRIHGKILAAPSVGQNPDIREMYWEKWGEKSTLDPGKL